MLRRFSSRAAALVILAVVASVGPWGISPAGGAPAATADAAVEASLLDVAQRLRDGQARVARLRAELREARAAVERLTTEVARARAEVGERREALVERVVDAYVELLRGHRWPVERLLAAEGRFKELTGRLTRARAAVEDRTEQLATAERRIEPLADEQAGLQADVAARLNEFQAQLAASGAVGFDPFTALLGERHRRAEEAGSVGAPPDEFVAPHPGAVTSRFGPRWGRAHNGIDLDGATGDGIVSAADGLVVFAGARGGFGNVVVVDHGGGVATLYAHLSTVAVTAGQPVGAGTPLGQMGCTGVCTGDHLHLEIRVGGVPQDPDAFFSFEGA